MLLLAMPAAFWGTENHAPLSGWEGERTEAEEILHRTYWRELGRAPDASGTETYLPLLAQGERDEAWLAKVLRDSPEGKERRAARWVQWQRAGGVWLRFMVIWSLLALGLWSLGDRVCGWVRRLDSSRQETGDVFQHLWIGAGLTVIMLQLWHLVLPVNTVSFILGTGLFVWSVSGALYARYGAARRKADSKTASARKTGLLLLLVFIPLSLLAAALATRGGITGYDTYLYHLQVLRWQNEYPAVPGIANLHIRLGFNTVWLLWASWLNVDLLGIHPARVLSAGVPLLFVLYLLYIVFQGDAAGKRSRGTALLLLPYAFLQIVAIVPHLYYDVPATIFLAVFFVEWLRRVDRLPERRAWLGPVSAQDVLVIGMPIAVSFVIKPLGAPMLMLAMCWIAGSLWGHFKARTLTPRVGGAHVLPMLIPAGWMARNIVLSGWLLFPAPVLPLPVDWAVPREPRDVSHMEQLQSLNGLNEIFTAWARCPGPYYEAAIDASFREWFVPWYQAQRKTLELRWLFPAGVFSILAGLMASGFGWHRDRWAWFMVFWAGVGLAFWFVSAPDLRYGFGLFCIWAALGIGGIWADILSRHFFLWAGLLAVAVFVIGGFSVSLRPVHGRALSEWRTSGPPASAVLPVGYEESDGAEITLYQPVQDDLCGDALLPCTPYPRENLKWRKAGQLRHGFRIEAVPR